MDEYDQFDIEYAGKLLVRAIIGLIIATILSFIFYLVILQENAFNIFKGVAQFNQRYVEAVNPVITTTLVVLMMGLVSPTAYFLPITNNNLALPLALSSLVIWIIVGIVVGLISKDPWKGLEAGFMSTLFTVIATLIIALIVVFSIGLLLGGTLVAFGWFLLIIGVLLLASLSFGISLAFGFIGGYIGSKVFKRY